MSLEVALTGLLNREIFITRLEALSEAGADGAHLFLDIDFFRRINDTCGHATGYEALRSVGPTLAKFFRADDLIGRIGGEEFGIFPHSMKDGLSQERAEMLRVAISETIVFCSESRIIDITASIGGAICAPGLDADNALRRADINHYSAKNNGRNQVVFQAG